VTELADSDGDGTTDGHQAWGATGSVTWGDPLGPDGQCHLALHLTVTFEPGVEPVRLDVDDLAIRGLGCPRP
jgi:hypothetical protein